LFCNWRVVCICVASDISLKHLGFIDKQREIKIFKSSFMEELMMSTNKVITTQAHNVSRRKFVTGLSIGGIAFGAGLWRPSALAQDKAFAETPLLKGNQFNLSIGTSPVNFTGKTRNAITVNHSLPAPTLRWREGDTVTIKVTNNLVKDFTSIHWHGLLLPANMDGVPGFSFDGIQPNESYLYRFKVQQSGTYWYHSHSLFQEQRGLYGAIIIDPLTPEPFSYDRDYVVMLNDWTDLSPDDLYSRLKKMSSYDNFYKRTVSDFLHDAKRDGLSKTLADRKNWGEMRMTPTDISDVNGNTYTYLMNGNAPNQNWTCLFKAGEKIRLRFINGSAMTHFDVRIPGLNMTVVAADGQYIHPISIEEFRIAAAETFDVIVEPKGQDAFTIFAQDIGRTGYALGTLAIHEGLTATIPNNDARPVLAMSDMGHDMASMKGMEGSCGASMKMDHGDANMKGMEGSCGASMKMDHGDANMKGMEGSCGASMKMDHGDEDLLVDMRSMSTTAKLDDPGIGLRNNGRKVLTYSQLHSLFDDPDGREPKRDIELHLTGHMEKFSWSFDGKKFMDAEPIKLKYGERVRITLINDTMMTHPIHLHGMWSDLENEKNEFQVRKHTIDMPPGTKRSYRVTANALGRWAYHCHMLYHMEAGMMREVRVEEWT
jgi:CopA family copper-resistance protein